MHPTNLAQLAYMFGSLCGISNASDNRQVCELISNGCKHLNLTCGTQTVQSSTCTQSNFEQVVQQLAQAGALPPTGLTSTSESLWQQCGDTETASNTLTQLITCEDAGNLVGNILQSVNTTTACAMSVLSNTIAQGGVVQTPAYKRNAAMTSGLVAAGILMVCVVVGALVHTSIRRSVA